MKITKKAVVLGTTAAAAAAILSGCIPTTVYGPPSVSETPAPIATFQPDENVPVCLYGPPPTDLPPVSVPEDNLPELVYGPPSFFEKDG